MAIVKSTGNSHWYSRTGIPTYEVPYAETNKAKRGQFRSTTLTDARKMDLLPSVTNILDVKAKPALINWKLEWAIISAITSQQQEGESMEEWAERIARDAEEIASSAAKFGSRVHQSIEDYLVQGEITVDEEIVPYFENWMAWAQDNLDLSGAIFSERVVVGDGYAGRADLKARPKLGSPFYQQIVDAGHNAEDYGTIDFKTRRWKVEEGKKSKPALYDSDPSQLAAYLSADISMASEEEADDCSSWVASVLINSEVPTEPIFVKVWSEAEIEKGMKVFRACQELWVLDRDYDPRKNVLAQSEEAA